MVLYQAHKAKRVACAACIIAVTLLLDQVSKALVRQTIALTHERVVALRGVLNFLYVENRGAAFGIFEGATSSSLHAPLSYLSLA